MTVESATIYVSAITLNKTSATLYEGETTQLNATVSPSTATNKSVNWTSSNASVATVSANGLVTAKSPGTTTIVCKAKDGSGKNASCTITVKEAVKPTAITLNKQKASITEGSTLQLTATITPADAADKTITWMSDNNDVAAVDNNGLVTAKSVGTANIIATTSNHLAAVCSITVRKKGSTGAAQWAGCYKVASRHVEKNPTRTYQDDFEMTITEKDGTAYITSMFGDDLTKYNDVGFELQDNGDGTATVDLNEYGILKYTGTSNPLYVLYVFDEAADDWADSWTLKKNQDGSINVGEFYVIAFTWSEADDKWTNGTIEALYYNMTAKTNGASGIEETVADAPNMHIDNGTVRLDKAAFVTVYRDNGTKVFAGKTDCIENLPKGLYIIRIGKHCKKIAIQ